MVSPDGTSVYVTAQKYGRAGPGVDAITELARDADGALHPLGCLANGGARGCRASRLPLEGVRHLAIGPDGRDLYALANVGLLEFSIGAGGRLRPVGCIALAPGSGHSGKRCRRLAAGVPLGPNGIVLSPDGADLYVTGAMKEKGFPRPAWVGGIYELARRPDGTVDPTPLGCFGPTDARGCATIKTYDLIDPVVSPDGSALYAVGYQGIWRFPRAANGSLGAPSCVLGSSDGCEPSYLGYTSLAISPDGSLLYVGTIGETSAYSIGPTGTLTQVAASPVPSERLALSPDGTRLYGAVYGAVHDGIRTFAVGGDSLSPLGGLLPIPNVEGMAVTPDGGTLLATSSCGCRGALLAYDSATIALPVTRQTSLSPAANRPSGIEIVRAASR
ncbi:MAG TPA: hypothetical protein VN671_02625 [Solirubrobacterales bacterium]|nr:hypothetical protein [Solirubrobacterales bacterium]